MDAGQPTSGAVAAQYFATQGFFSTYNARPTAPCDRETAVAWLEAMEAIVGEHHDPQQLADRMRRIETDTTLARRAILVRSFRDLARRILSGTRGFDSQLSESIRTRSLDDALALLYGLVPDD